jgi:hypothetical protein
MGAGPRLEGGPGLSEGRFQRIEITNARCAARDFEDGPVKCDDLPEGHVTHQAKRLYRS